MTNPRFLCGECISLHGFQFGLHGRTEFIFQRIQRHFVLRGQVFGDVRLHGVDTFGDGLLAKASLASKIGSQTLFLPEPSSCAQGLVQRRRIG